MCSLYVTNTSNPRYIVLGAMPWRFGSSSVAGEFEFRRRPGGCVALAPVQHGGCVASGPLWKSEWRLRRSPVRMVVTLVTWAAKPSTRLDHGLRAGDLLCVWW